MRKSGIAARRALLGLALAAASPAAAEFQVNTTTYSSQIAGGVARRANGEYVVVWHGFTGLDGRWEVFARRFTGAGVAIGGEFRVNSITAGDQQGPVVGADGSGGFIVAWTDQGVMARRYDANANPVGAEFRLNAFTTAGGPSLAVQDDGSFIAAWRSYYQDGFQAGVYARRFDTAGAPLGPEFQVNTTTIGDQEEPTVAADDAGKFVVVWRSRNTNPLTPYDAYAQRFAADGTRLGGEMALTAAASGDQNHPTVAVRPSGEFIAAWGDIELFTRSRIQGQWFDAQGSPAGPEFTISTYPNGFHGDPSASFDAAGGLLVAWENPDQDGYFEGVFAQRFDPSGARVGSEFRVNTYTSYAQQNPHVAAGASGSYMVVWTSFNQDGDSYGVFGDVFSDLQPEFLRVDAAGNGVFEAGETATINPAWRNVSGAPLPFAGTATSFTGPGAPNAPAYSIVDGIADYGAVAHGAASDCVPTGDCYQLATGVPPARPAFHWDATFREDLAPGAPGRSKDWTLHVGGTFDDVSTTSPFYRFIETLVHNGASGGCLPASYCPSQGMSRAAMAVFVLVAHGGPGYAPPPCGATPQFADVPVSSPFCRWVEELARRGVVTGCGGGNFCPEALVSREQMPVFVLRTLDPLLDPPPCPFEPYLDVPVSSPFCRWIFEAAVRAVVTGCGNFMYCPTAPVTREQASVFVTVTFGLQLYGP